jgi:hypothetical protein
MTGFINKTSGKTVTEFARQPNVDAGQRSSDFYVLVSTLDSHMRPVLQAVITSSLEWQEGAWNTLFCTRLSMAMSIWSGTCSRQAQTLMCAQETDYHHSLSLQSMDFSPSSER